MTSGSVSRRRRQLEATVDPEKRKEFKVKVSRLAIDRTNQIRDLRISEAKDINNIRNKYGEQRVQATRAYERERAELIEGYENDASVS